MASCYSSSLLLSFLLLNHLAPSLSQSQSNNTFHINVWPKPKNVSWPIPTVTTISPHFNMHYYSPSPLHPHLQAAISRYSLLIRSEAYHPLVAPPDIDVNLITSSQPVNSLLISVSGTPHEALQHGVDESYTLSISSSSGTASLTARTMWGAMHGLETFSQLCWGSPPVVASDIFIRDGPDFPHRGIVLDTSRNFYPKRDIMRTIDAMAANKLNVFHWHITDSHSFPIVLAREPELAEKGSYGPGMRYAADDVREIVEYGWSRGVRVMPEIDMPG